ncbi:MAG: peptidylprolyl isomerase [Saprospiraceae bacterium]|jgi:cyclophilin family peptidyl-prolyl cis-trans isomerase/HEAT repeat protein
MNYKLLIFICVLLGTIMSSCVPDTGNQMTDIVISMSDPEIQKITDLKDKQDLKGLYDYFRNENPSYRYQAVIAFASIKKAEANDSLVAMLQDPVMQVRSAAAFAIGQSGDSKITDRLILSFRGKDTLNVNNIFNANVLEAVGKTGNISDLKSLATVRTYRSTDTLLLLGQARAIFRMALRNITCDEGTSRMVDLLYTASVPKEVKVLAAQYFGRAKDINLSLSKVRLTDIFTRERNPDIRMALATAFGKSKDIDFLPALKTAMIAETDYRVKCNVMRALGNFPYIEFRDIAFKNLKNDNLHIASTAAGVFMSNGFIEDVPEYMKYDTVTIPWQVRAKMNGAVLAHTALYFTKSKTAFSERIKKNLKDAESLYAKAAYVDALSKDPYNYMILMQIYAEEKNQLIKISAIEGIGNILKNPLFFRAFGNGFGRIKAEMLNTLANAITSGDVGQIAAASVILKEPSLQWKEWLKDLTFMKEALAKLKLPKEVEAYNELQSCISFLEGKEYKADRPAYNHPIDWALLQTVSDSSIAAIKTTQGLIRVKLYKKNAPGSVANFVHLINEKFYNGKAFHRVVPNFVIQTGCPRGDGYGSLDYSIRSELPQIYYNGEGYIGMASAGIDTEGTQWFITHSATPHLDGNYTIFGKVVEGMDVVHKIQQGDKINEIIFVK